MKKLILISAVFLIVPLLSYSQEKELYQLTTMTSPEQGMEKETYLGDQLILKQVGAWRECITPKQTYYGKEAGRTMLYKANEPLCKITSKDKWYFPSYDNYTFYGLKPEPVIWKAKKNKSSLCSKGGWACVKKLPEDAVEVGIEFVSTEPTQKIEYLGKKGNILSFVYSKNDPLDKDSATREIDLDMTEGNILAFKGALIEVIEGKNMSIKYKVVKQFKD